MQQSHMTPRNSPLSCNATIALAVALGVPSDSTYHAKGHDTARNGAHVSQDSQRAA